MEPELPIEQDEARRRLLAAVALSPNLTSIERLGGLGGFRHATWKAIGTTDRWGRLRRFLPRHALLAAVACGVPYEWFTVPDLAEAVRLGAERIAASDEPHAGDRGAFTKPLDEAFDDDAGSDSEHRRDAS